MRWGPILMCCWPGLARLWTRGHASSLLVAFGFAIVLNLALISTFLWPTSLGETFPLVAWPTILLVWTVSAWVSYKSLPDVMAVGSQPRQNTVEIADTLFNQAQREYLRGHLAETESLLKRSLETAPRDIESRLLLATMFRHQRRFDEAREELKTIRKFDESVNWDFEISRERQLLELIETADSEDDNEDATLQSQTDSLTASVGATEADLRGSNRNHVQMSTGNGAIAFLQ